MSLKPVELMLGRVNRARSDCDTSLFHELMYAGEFVVKLTAATFIAFIDDDRDLHRYRLLHTLIRADGLGEWSKALDDALAGPASSNLVAVVKERDRRIFTERLGTESWQYDAVLLLQNVLRQFDHSHQNTPAKVALRAWFSSFVELRNKTRGHGAPTPGQCSHACPDLMESIHILCKNNPIFSRSWAYLRRTLSGKYHVVPPGEDSTAFDNLKKSEAIKMEPLPDGVYVHVTSPRRVELLHTDLDVSDFFVPNGGFNGRHYELHSLITDSRREGDASPYLASATERPPSETHGLGKLDVSGNVWSNLPSVPPAYVKRPRLEQEIVEALKNDRHPIITLVGRGGIGKTSLALTTLHRVADASRYEAIIWFSARDIDLTPSGPKVVKPHVLTEKDVASEFCNLFGISVESAKDTPATQVMAENLRKSSVSGPILFVFDNFETVKSPVDLFQWIDTNIRLPNKALITSRFRDFKADYPINISGMERAEADELISKTASALSINGLITSEFRDAVFEQSDGHPYVIKVMLGEVANKKSVSKPERILSRKDEILDALFERTFANLSPIASRIFLTLSSWRSLVAQLALEAILIRDQADSIDPGDGVEELIRMSLIQRTTAKDGTVFLDTPLAASLFARKKLSVSPDKFKIENDVSLLQELGATSSASMKGGIGPKIEKLFQKIAASISKRDRKLSEMRPMLEYIARSYSPAWLLLSNLQEEAADEDHIDQVTEYVRRYLENNPDGPESRKAWERLASLYKRSGNVAGAVGAFARAFDVHTAPLNEISAMATWLNSKNDEFASMDAADKASIFSPLIRLMEARLQQASGTDLSRLAWLHLHAGDRERALEIAELGLTRESDNFHCQGLVERLSS